MTVRMLTIEDADQYIEHMVLCDSESGKDGGVHFHVYSASEPFDMRSGKDRERRRWSTPSTETGWRRAWGMFDGDKMVGHLYLAGGTLLSELHRIQLGMGILKSHHRRGGGSLMLQSAIEWAQAQPHIAWIDLGVFVENTPAQILYAKFGFSELGRTPDRFRVDGHRIDDISMSLCVGEKVR